MPPLFPRGRALPAILATGALALAALAACAGHSNDPATLSPPASASPGDSASASADATASATGAFPDQAASCGTAQNTTNTAISDLTLVFLNAGGAFPTDAAGQATMVGQLQAIVGPWQQTLTDLSGKDITPELKQALTDALAAIPRLATVGSTTEATTIINGITASLTAACS